MSPPIAQPTAASTSESPESAPSALKVNTALVFVQVAFGTLPVAGKLAMVAIGPFALALFRVVGAAVFFSALAFGRAPRPSIPLGDVLRIAGCGLLGMAANQVLFLGGLERTTAVNATVLVTTIPVFTFAAAALFGHERFDRRGGAGLALALLGVLTLVPLERFSLAADGLIGDLMILTNSLCYALFLVWVRPLAGRYGTKPVVAIAFAASVLAVAPFGGPQLSSTFARVDTASALAALYVLIVPTVLAYLLNTWALRHARASTVAIFIYLQPILGLVLAMLILGEAIGLRTIGGAAAVFAGVWLVAGRRRPRPIVPDADAP